MGVLLLLNSQDLINVFVDVIRGLDLEYSSARVGNMSLERDGGIVQDLPRQPNRR